VPGTPDGIAFNAAVMKSPLTNVLQYIMSRFLHGLLIALFLSTFLTLEPGIPGLSGAWADQPTAFPGAGSPVHEAKPIFRSISAGEAAELIKSRQDLQIIDVRTPQERKQFRIADTRLVSVGDIMRGVFAADPSQPLMLVCAIGGRSYVAGKVMAARGYREIYNLDGGIESWRRAGLPLESGPEKRP
jgi:rhodanese-related sulfurtransferase